MTNDVQYVRYRAPAFAHNAALMAAEDTMAFQMMDYENKALVSVPAAAFNLKRDECRIPIRFGLGIFRDANGSRFAEWRPR